MNIFSLSASRLVSIASAVILAVVAARILGPNLYGQYALVFVFIGYFGVLLDFGISDIAVRDVSAGKASAQDFVRPVIVVRLILWVLSAVILLGTTFLWKNEIFVPMIAGVIIILGEGLYNVYDPLFRGVQEMKWLSIVEIVFSIIRTGAGILALLYDPKLFTFLLAVAAATMAKVGLVFVFYRMKFGSSTPLHRALGITAILRESFSNFSWKAVSIIYMQMNVPLIAFMIGDAAAGHFKASMNFVDLPTNFVTILLAVLFPFLSSIHSKSFPDFTDRMKWLLTVMITLFFPLYLLVVSFGADAVTLVFGHKYDEGARLLPILFLQVLTSLTLGLIGVVFLVQRRQATAFYLTIATVATKAILLVVGAKLGSLEYVCWGMIAADFVSISLHIAWLLARGGWNVDILSRPLLALVVGVSILVAFLVTRSFHAVPIGYIAVIFLFLNLYCIQRFRFVNLLDLRKEFRLL